ncbi:TIGR04104 family putative zinc finger protein [Salipaludibacillus aurantiacus]|uniref:Cxxc_20_cxxc protein n=1 Tax=Salipaludibacillus aurantiacus TaxID=1601833 RepID=A0A1H9Q5A6_9BACI|nr:cxxc_20_cxxc protein [Salipaludibacillus aurantiacus]
MLKCPHCNTASFKRSKILKANWIFSTIQCNNCGKKSRITYFSRLIVVALTVVPFLIFGLILSPFDNVLVTIFVAILIAFTGSLLTPYLVKYKIEEKNAS